MYTLYIYTHTYMYVRVLVLWSSILGTGSVPCQVISPFAACEQSALGRTLHTRALGQNHPCWAGPLSLLARDRPSVSRSGSYGVKAGRTLSSASTTSVPTGDTCLLTSESFLQREEKHACRRQAAEASSSAAVPAELPGSHELIYPF